MFAPEEQLCCHNNYVAPEEQLCCHFFCIVTVCAVLAIALCKDFPQMFSCLRRSDRRERDGMGHSGVRRKISWGGLWW